MLTFLLAPVASAADDKPTDGLADDPAVAAVRKLGGTVRVMARGSRSLEVEFHVGGRGLNDDGLKRVAALKRTASLNLRGTKITDAGLQHLKGLASLRQRRVVAATLVLVVNPHRPG